jgi:hypothetical protein
MPHRQLMPPLLAENPPRSIPKLPQVIKALAAFGADSNNRAGHYWGVRRFFILLLADCMFVPDNVVVQSILPLGSPISRTERGSGRR